MAGVTARQQSLDDAGYPPEGFFLVVQTHISFWLRTAAKRTGSNKCDNDASLVAGSQR